LEANLAKYALISAFKDDRFSPIQLKEVESLSVGVSLLTNFEEASNPYDWEVGKHGIEIDFEFQGKSYGATFLPEVAEEESWDQKITLKELIRKAGYNGKVDNVFNFIKTTRYQSIKTYLNFKEYQEIRKI
jgi:uncharacterized protein (TIGR00296 family)